MLRFLELLLFLSPFIAFAVWRLLLPASGPSPRLMVLAAGALLLLAGGLYWFSQQDALPRNSAYAPAQLQDGRLLPGPRRAAMTDALPCVFHPPPGWPIRCSPRCWTRCRKHASPAARCAIRWPAGRWRISTWRRRVRPQPVIAALASAGIRSVPTGLAHGTVTAVAGGRGFEITTLRRDVQTDGRHAVVAFTDDWQEDAARRDFTLNALSMTRDGAVFDYFDGIADLRAGVVRFVGDPASRIAEDYLRILRFFRFYARYAAGPPDPAALAAIRAGVPGLARAVGGDGCGASCAASLPHPIRAGRWR